MVCYFEEGACGLIAECCYLSSKHRFSFDITGSLSPESVILRHIPPQPIFFNPLADLPLMFSRLSAMPKLELTLTALCRGGSSLGFIFYMGISLNNRKLRNRERQDIARINEILQNMQNHLHRVANRASVHSMVRHDINLAGEPNSYNDRRKLPSRYLIYLVN